MARTLDEILESAKDGLQPSSYECYWSMLALDALLGLEISDLLEINDPIVDECVRRRQEAKAVAPQSYIGRANDPANPDYQRQRSAMKKIHDRFTR